MFSMRESVSTAVLDFAHEVHDLLEGLGVDTLKDYEEDSVDESEECDSDEDEHREVIDGQDFFEVFTHRWELDTGEDNVVDRIHDMDDL